MKIQYSYKVYKDFPEATEISESRERSGTMLSILFGSWFVVSLVLAFTVCETASDWIEAILSILVSGLLIWYMRYRYPKRTEQLIQESIRNQIDLKENWEEIKFRCKAITLREGDCKEGTCFTCYQKNTLTRCKVKQDAGKRDIYICQACMDKFRGTAEKVTIEKGYIQKVVAQKAVAQKAVAPKTTGRGMRFLRGLFATILLWFIGRVFPSIANAYIYEVCNLNSAVFLSAIVHIGSIFLAYWTADTLTLRKSINCIRVNLIIVLVIEALGVIGSFGYLVGSTEGLQAVFMDGLYIGACGYLTWLASKRIEKSEGK